VRRAGRAEVVASTDIQAIYDADLILAVDERPSTAGDRARSTSGRARSSATCASS